MVGAPAGFHGGGAVACGVGHRAQAGGQLDPRPLRAPLLVVGVLDVGVLDVGVLVPGVADRDLQHDQVGHLDRADLHLHLDAHRRRLDPGLLGEAYDHLRACRKTPPKVIVRGGEVNAVTALYG
jgi:hypothetical protein